MKLFELIRPKLLFVQSKPFLGALTERFEHYIKNGFENCRYQTAKQISTNKKIENVFCVVLRLKVYNIPVYVLHKLALYTILTETNHYILIIINNYWTFLTNTCVILTPLNQ